MNNTAITLVRRHHGWLAFIFLICGGLLAVLHVSGYRINTTASMPPGLYRIVSEPVQRLDFVSYCLEESPDIVALAKERQYLKTGGCPSGLQPLFKQVAGLPGDKIRIEADRIMVNDRPMPNSTAKRFDRQGRPMPEKALDGTIPSGQALLLADHAGSFDSRYFGLVPLASLQRVEPVIVNLFTGETP